jgi:hypothetical protein
MNPLAGFDHLYLRFFDNLILWLWNRFGIRKVDFSRVCYLGWAFTAAIRDYLAHTSFLTAIFDGAVILVLAGVSEHRQNSLSVEMQNATALRYRDDFIHISIRYLFYILPIFAIFSLIETIANHVTKHMEECIIILMRSLFSTIGVLAAHYVLVPEKPRKKREPKKASIAVPNGVLVTTWS